MMRGRPNTPPGIAAPLDASFCGYALHHKRGWATRCERAPHGHDGLDMTHDAPGEGNKRIIWTSPDRREFTTVEAYARPWKV